MMRRPTAAAYCDMSVAAFEREIAAGRLPAGVSRGCLAGDDAGTHAIDRAMRRSDGASGARAGIRPGT
jgi:hypothetical protein